MIVCKKFEEFMRDEIYDNPNGYLKLKDTFHYMNHTFHYWGRLNVIGCIGFRLYFSSLSFTWYVTGGLYRSYIYSFVITFIPSVITYFIKYYLSLQPA
jgi:hypothetical protein